MSQLYGEIEATVSFRLIYSIRQKEKQRIEQNGGQVLLLPGVPWPNIAPSVEPFVASDRS